MPSKLIPGALALVALTAQAQSQQPTQTSTLNLYGQANAAIVHRTHQTGDSSVTGLGNSPFGPSLFGFRGREDLGGGMSAFFQMEGGISIDTGTQVNAQRFWNRSSIVGLTLSPMATITLGRQLHAGPERVSQSLDSYNVAGSALDVTPLIAFGVNKFAQNDARADDSIKLRLKGPNGLNLGLSAALENASGTSQSFDLAQITPHYTLGLWGVQYKALDAAATGIVPKHRAYGLGGNVPVGPVRLYAHYLISTMDPLKPGMQQTRNRIVHLGAAWKATSNVTLKAALYHDKGKSINNVAGRDGTKNTLVLSGDYALSKRTSFTLGFFNNRFEDGYQLDPLNVASLSRDPKASSTTGLSFGINHRF